MELSLRELGVPPPPPPLLSGKSFCLEPLAELGGTPAPSGKNPLSIFCWPPLLLSGLDIHFVKNTQPSGQGCLWQSFLNAEGQAAFHRTRSHQTLHIFAIEPGMLDQDYNMCWQS